MLFNIGGSCTKSHVSSVKLVVLFDHINPLSRFPQGGKALLSTGIVEKVLFNRRVRKVIAKDAKLN